MSGKPPACVPLGVSQISHNGSSNMNRMISFNSVIMSITGALLVLVLAMAFVGLGGLVHQLLVYGGIVWLGLPGGITALIYAAMTVPTRGWLSLRPLGWIAGFCVVAFASCKLGDKFCDWEMARAKVAAPELVDKIQQHHLRHGSFPVTLAEIENSHSVPRLLRYERSSDHFDLQIHDPRQLFVVWGYDQETHTWVKILDD